MEQISQDDIRTEFSKPEEPGITMRMVEKGIQKHNNILIFINSN